MINNNSPSIVYSSGWATAFGPARPPDYQNDIAYTNTNGSSATLSFTRQRDLVDHRKVEHGPARSVCRSTVVRPLPSTWPSRTTAYQQVGFASLG